MIAESSGAPIDAQVELETEVETAAKPMGDPVSDYGSEPSLGSKVEPNASSGAGGDDASEAPDESIE